MSIWNNKDHHTILDDAEDLGHSPSGGRVRQWLCGIGLAGIPVAYGINSILIGHTTLFGSRGSGGIDLRGTAGLSLAISYIALGTFAHFHYFWGLSPRLWPCSIYGKVLSLVVFPTSLLYALYLAFI
ncbi:hypothetical protein [Luteolibacter sp. AS25]|uniref:hypothetical protein n=1 Tax=Luteolibacter sp. AS25 TaxID=3135776 RepID=UPI00398A95B2